MFREMVLRGVVISRNLRGILSTVSVESQLLKSITIGVYARTRKQTVFYSKRRLQG